MPDIQINATRIFYQWDGPSRGDVVMLSNSLASNLGMWVHQVPALVEAGFRVLRYDSRGMGASQVPVGPYTVGMLADDVIALMDALDVERVHFCGLSKGGMVGQTLGAQAGDRLSSLALCDTAAYMPAPEVWDERIAAVRAGGMSAVVDGTVDRWFTPAGQARVAKDVADVRKMILDTPVEGFAACCEAIKAMDQRPTLGAIATPTLVIVGEDDPGTPVAAAELIHRSIAGSELVVIPESAHFCNMEQPQAFNEALLGFVRRHA
ncbi:MAG: 3-oxoadipate enol-lactonase [Gammaproteobacteria bacterium]